MSLTYQLTKIESLTEDIICHDDVM